MFKINFVYLKLFFPFTSFLLGIFSLNSICAKTVMRCLCDGTNY